MAKPTSPIHWKEMESWGPQKEISSYTMNGLMLGFKGMAPAEESITLSFGFKFFAL